MTFPYYIHVGSIKLHPHPVMELIAYSAAFQFYWWLRRRHPEARVPMDQNLWVIVGAAAGALVGAKSLAWVESAPSYLAAGFAGLIGGKTIVGALLGGWAGVEIAKKFVGLHERTGDLFVLPLALGMAIGRIGCFLTGLSDHTYGIATSLPWGVNFGDGIPRHPTQLYEMIFLLLWGAILWIWWNRSLSAASEDYSLITNSRQIAARYSSRNSTTNMSRLLGLIQHPASQSAKQGIRQGNLFRIFLIGYLAMRLAIEFIKPTWKPYLGLSAIQLACIGGIIVAGWQIWRAPPSVPGSKPSEVKEMAHA